MLTIPEVKSRLLSELEEFRHENIPCLMNTIFDEKNINSDLEQIREALRELVTEGFVMLLSRIDRDAGRETANTAESLALVDSIDAHIVYDVKRSCWTDNRRDDPPYFDVFDHVRVTPAGLEEARNILDQRGYQWWRRRP